MSPLSLGRMFAQPGTLLTPSGVYRATTAESGGPATIPVRFVGASAPTPFQLVSGAREVASTLCSRISPGAGPGEMLDSLCRSECPNALAVALFATAEIDLLPLIRRQASGDRSAGAESPGGSAETDSSVPPNGWHPTDEGVSLEDVLEQIGFPGGFCIRPDGRVLRLETHEGQSRMVRGGCDPQDLAGRIDRFLGGRATARRERAREAVAQLVGDLFERMPIARRVSEARSDESIDICEGPPVRVTIEKMERLVLRRAIPSWTVVDYRSRRRFPPVDIRVGVTITCSSGVLVDGVAVTQPAITHPFVDERGRICIATYRRRTRGWAEEALGLLDAAESVLVSPMNPSGDGGYRSLESCPDYNAEAARG